MPCGGYFYGGNDKMTSFYGTATLCEVKYNSVNEECHTPYRFSCWSAGARDNVLTPDIPVFNLPSSCSVSYYEYLRSLYEGKAPASSKLPGYASSSISTGNQSSKSHTVVYASNSYASKHGYIKRRPKTAITLQRSESPGVPPQQQKSLPSILHHDEEEEELFDDDEYTLFEDKIVWVDALNKWVPEQQLQPKPYLSFVGTAPTVAKLYSTLKENLEDGDVTQRECDRYNRHMESYKSSGLKEYPLHPDNSYTNRLTNLKKREEMRRRAEEMMEQRRQRKSHTSPTQSLLSEKKQKVRFRVASKKESTSADETPVPVIEEDKVTSPTKDETDLESGKSDEMEAADDVFAPSTESESKDSLNHVKDEALDSLPVSPLSEVTIDSFKFEDKKDDIDTSITLPPLKKEPPVPPKKKVRDVKKKTIKERVKPLPTTTTKTPAKVKSSKSLVKVTSKKSMTTTKDKSVEILQPIPTVGDTKTGPLELKSSPKRAGTPREKKELVPSANRRQSILRKERYELQKLLKDRSSGSPTSDQDFLSPSPSDEEVEEEFKDELSNLNLVVSRPHVCIDEPALPDPILEKEKRHKSRRGTLVTPLPKFPTQKKRLGRFRRDTSYEDELRKFELAEKRRQKQMEMLEKLKSKRHHHDIDVEDDDDDSPNFDDYGFLAKYCIFNKGHLQTYKYTFDIVDDENKGWLTPVEVMMALRGVNNKLTDAEEEYLYRILELTGYSVTKGADFKLFSVLAALSQKISSLDNWMRNQIGKMDFQMLEMKTFMCKTLWECNVDHETNKIPLEQLCVDLRAGGISLEHEDEVRRTLSHLRALDLLDFLTYIPLFIMIHQSVVENPLDTSRDK